METLIFNFNWMTVNSLLACMSVFAGWAMLKSKNIVLKFIFSTIWLSFIPNTIYIVTDVVHIPEQWDKVIGFEKGFLILEYVVLEIIGFLTYIFALYAFERLLLSSRWKKQKNGITLSIILLNFLVAFGVVLGRFQRTNSWEVFTNTSRVLVDSMGVLFSVDLLLFVLYFTLLGNTIYFYFRDPLTRYMKRLV